MLSIRRCFCGEEVAGDEEIGKPVGFSRFAKERQSFEQAKAVRRCRGIARPGLIKHQLADVEVEILATLLPPATRQLLSGLEYNVGGRSRGQVANNRGFDVDRAQNGPANSRNARNQRLATLRGPHRPILSRVRCIALFG